MSERAQNFPHARESGDPDPVDVLPLDLPDIGREWSRGERSVLRVLLNPQYFRATAQERAAAAGISSRRYHQIMQQRDFRPAIAACFKSALQVELMPVIHAAIQTAKTPTGEGAKDREMLLTMAGMLNRGRATSPPPAAAPTCGIIAVASMEELG